MTIRPEHPFLPGAADRDPLRRLRGRLPAPVSVWTAGAGSARAGWTVSSFLLADGRPAEVLGLLDEESTLADRLAAEPTFVVNLLGAGHAFVAEAFAGLAPAPGGPFRLAGWTDSAWGPVLDDAVGWLGVRLARPVAAEHAGWGLLVRGTVETATLGDPDADVLAHLRGRYHTPRGDA